MNLADRAPFIKATEDLLGGDGVHWLMAFKPLQDSSAFRLFCKATGKNIDEYNEIAKNIEDYENHPYWGPIIEESKVFKGVVESVAPSPCSFLLLDKPISEEVGILKVGDEYCANLDGYNCDVYKYLKNDYLSVTVWKIIAQTCDLAGIEIPTIRELNQLLDEKTYKMYELGLTCTLNQADSNFGTESVKTLKPKNVGEMSAFVAAIRPGFASLLDNFLNRRGYTTGVKQLDELLDDSFHYLMYQESIMKYLVWLGMEESRTYDIIKKISKKKFDPHELEELKGGLKQNWTLKVGTVEGFEETWQVIEDAANYSFNASHSLSVGLDSLYGAYLKSHYPLEYFSVCLNEYSDDIERTSRLIEELKHFGITLSPAKFGYSKGSYFFDRESNTIYKGVGSFKFLNGEIGDMLYELKDNNYNNFFELIKDIKFINSKQLTILIKVGYFSQFGKTHELLEYVDIYNKYANIKVFKTDNYMAPIVKMFANKVTEKQLREIDNMALCNYLCEQVNKVDLPIKQIIEAQYEFTGSVNYIDENADKKECVVLNLDTKYTPQVMLYQLCSGKIIEAKITTKFLRENQVENYDIIKITSTKKQQKKKKIDGKWELIPEYYYFVEYEIKE